MGVSATSYILFLENQGRCLISVIVIKALFLKTTESVTPLNLEIFHFSFFYCFYYILPAEMAMEYFMQLPRKNIQLNLFPSKVPDVLF